MEMQILTRYTETIYAYAINHTYSREEADELSQEILFTAVKQLPKLRDDSRFEPWLWGIASNVTKRFRRECGKRRAMFSYDSLDTLVCEEDCAEVLEREEAYRALRTQIAMLSAAYRDIIVLHYYDGLSTKAISDRLGIPEGTVRWRLTEARRKLKKEYESMEATALKPHRLLISMSGEGEYNPPVSPFPNTFISDALSQNILYYCYGEPKSAEELAHLCGVPAYYIEDRTAELVRREALSEPQRGRYRTEFLIYSAKTAAYAERAKGIFEPAVCPAVQAMSALADGVDALGIHTGGRGRGECLYLWGLMAMEHLSQRHNPCRGAAHPVRYDGYAWSYHAFRADDVPVSVKGLGRQLSANLGSRGSYSHYTYCFGDFAHRPMMYDYEINVCEDILTRGDTDDTETAAAVIERGIVQRRNDGFYVTVPAFTHEQYRQFCRLAETAFAPVMPVYTHALNAYIAGYRKLFPAYLEQAPNVACDFLFLSLFASAVYDIAADRGLLSRPAPGSICDVLIQHK